MDLRSHTRLSIPPHPSPSVNRGSFLWPFKNESVIPGIQPNPPSVSHADLARISCEPCLQTYLLNAVSQFLGVVLYHDVWNFRHHGRVVLHHFGHQREQAFQVALPPQPSARWTRPVVRCEHRDFQIQRLADRRSPLLHFVHQREQAFQVPLPPQPSARWTRPVVRCEHRDFQIQRLEHRRTDPIREGRAYICQRLCQQSQESIVRDRTEHADGVLNFLLPEKFPDKVLLALRYTDEQEPHLRKCFMKAPYGFRQKVEREFFAEAHVAKEDSLMAAAKFNYLRWQSRRSELYIVRGKMRNRFHSLRRNTSGKQNALHRRTVAVDALGNSKQQRKRQVPQGPLRCGKIALPMAAGVSQQSWPSSKPRQQQRGEGQKKTFLCLPVDSYLHRVAAPHQACHLRNIIPSALHIDVVRTAYPAIFV